MFPTILNGEICRDCKLVRRDGRVVFVPCPSYVRPQDRVFA